MSIAIIRSFSFPQYLDPLRDIIPHSGNILWGAARSCFAWKMDINKRNISSLSIVSHWSLFRTNSSIVMQFHFWLFVITAIALPSPDEESFSLKAQVIRCREYCVEGYLNLSERSGYDAALWQRCHISCGDHENDTVQEGWNGKFVIIDLKK